MAAMQLTVPLILGKPVPPESARWMKLLVGFDVIYTAVSVYVAETVLVG